MALAALGLGACAGNTGATTNTSSSGVLAALDKRSGGPTVKPKGPAKPATEASADTARAKDRKTPPMDIAQPPDDARTTASGLAFKVLRTADTGRMPGPNDTVKVDYTAWQTSGAVIYSTFDHGKPQTMPLFQAPPGWREAVLDMRVGERRLYWMPGHLASAVTTMATAKMLVFDVELRDIHSAPAAPANLSAPPADAERGAAGLAYKVVSGTGEGEPPNEWDEVAVHYTIWKQDGSLHQDTTHESEPRRVRPMDEFSGFAAAVALARKGQKLRVWLPEEARAPLRSGDRGGLHTMDIEVFDVVRKPGPPPTPADVAKPPKDAKKTAKGVYYKLLHKGDGKRKPTSSDTVTVHYTGWTTDGKRFDSSQLRGKPTSFGLTDVIAGWTDVVQQMVVGDRIRTWIPEHLAYQGQPGRPAGMLVFEIELIAIEE
jgi:peptidylprolyl isomerase